MLKEPGLQNLNNITNQIAIIPTGIKVAALDKEYGKDYLAHEVETSNELKGCLIHSSKVTLTTHH